MTQAERIELGRSGERVSAVGIGLWQWGSSSWGWNRGYGKADVLETFDRALELGIDFFDTAEAYGRGRSESLLGEALQGRRDEAFIASKVLPWRLTNGAMEKAADRSLRRLNADVIDLYQLHFPSPLVPIGRVVRAMEKLVAKGKVRYLGVSNVGVRGLRKAREALASEDIVSDQVHYNLLWRKPERGLLRYASQDGITLIAYSPLEQGLLTGKYGQDFLPRDLVRSINFRFTPGNLRRASSAIDVLRRIAKARDVTPTQVALNWLRQSPSTLPIPGAKKVSHVEDVAAALSWTLSETERRELDEAFRAVKMSRWRGFPWIVGRSIRTSVSPRGKRES